MRSWSIPLVVGLAWFAFTLTPLWSLYNLARAVQDGDAEYIERHVNVRTLRLSLVRQLSDAIRASGEGGRAGQRIADVANVLAMPLADALVTPRMVIDLLDDGLPQGLALPEGAAAPSGGGGLRIGDLSRLGAYYLATEMRGFRTVVVAVPPDRPRAEQFRLRLRLRDWSWRLVEIDMNESLRGRIAASIAAAQRARGEKPAAKPDAAPAR